MTNCFGFELSEWFLWFALIGGGISVVATLIQQLSVIRVRTRAVTRAIESGQTRSLFPTAGPSLPAAPTILQSLGGLIDALAKAPVWFALFLAGFALLWLNVSTPAKNCAPTTSAEKR
jgi:hypothetical protein